jgi:oligopeptide/dipeptide ABC transporter ATP-binding protein
MSATPLLDVCGLEVDFATPQGIVRAVRGLDLRVSAGETLAIVGESGSGKSASALALLDLLPRTARVRGEALFEGRDLLADGSRHARAVRGGRVAMVFQDPLTSLNPYLTVGQQVLESVRLHNDVRGGAARQRVLDLFREVRLPDGASRVQAYPHQLSGGQRQRVIIAMALAGNPRLLLADEPTTALDVTVQAQVLELFDVLCRERGMALILITHDLAVVAGVAQRVTVMYAGRAVEEASVHALFAEPAHPYTRGLLASIPGPRTGQGLLPCIPGSPPNLLALSCGCTFAPRCPFRVAVCETDPNLTPRAPGHHAACHLQPADLTP